MNILITAPSLNTSKNVSGIATVVNTIIDNNKRHTYFHYLLGRPDKPMNKLVWLFALLKQLINFPFFVHKHNIDLVHQNLPFNEKGLMRESIINFWCYLLKVPVILHLHGGEFLMRKEIPGLYKYLSSQIFKHSSKVIVLSDVEKEALQQNHLIVNSFVLLNSVDTQKFKTENRTYDLKLPVFLFMGRIHESKGVNEIVEALKELKNKRAFKFVLCGTGPLLAYLTNKCAEFLGENFEYRGIVSGDSKQEALDSANFFLLPSRYGEGLPMALLEAMSSGLVPIVTNDASMKFVIQNEQNGIFVNKADSKDLFDKMIQVMDDLELQKSLSISARNTIVERYDVKPYVEQLNKLYDSVIAK